MAIVSCEVACEDLNQHLDAFDEMVRSAWKEYESLPPNCHLAFGPRSRASAVHDFVLQKAAAYAASNTGVQYFQRNLMHGIVIDGKYAIRFKKFDSESRSRNQPTQQVTEFRNQIELEGIDAAHHLEVGYLLDDLETEVQDVRLACPAGYGNAWVVSLSDRGAALVLADLFPPQLDGDASVEPADIAPRKTDDEIAPVHRKSV